MFNRLALFSALSVALLAVATPANVARGGGSSGSATTACCDSTEPADSAAGAALLKTIGVDLSDLNVLLGLTCSPISVIGVGSGSACSGTTVSCSNGVVHGIGIGCVPVTL
ncbi:fungal hydrophobin [Phanerochaete sordida]|uniref:Hydrophobin n=1 Tax=Phanerochaete sordida TaxID=48140 RepID=A0A9P3GKD1_9APHY|nr:fungal hydrophobin [Phanerochaete sordida]